MALNANTLFDATTYNGDKWVPARPEPGPLSWRLKDAWAVLTGKAEALFFPGQGPDAPRRP